MSFITGIFYFVLFVLLVALAVSLFLIFSYSFAFIFVVLGILYLMIAVVRRGLLFIYPFIEFTAKLFDINIDKIKRAVINYNNRKMSISIRKGLLKDASQILVLLPHCIQNSACLYKVTWDKLDNCRLCGKCCVPDFLKLKKEYGVDVAIVSGGSAAREMIKQRQPKAVIAVACENDLISGIQDVNNVPVFAVLNQRPAGPCRDTTVDIDTVRSYIIGIINSFTCPHT